MEDSQESAVQPISSNNSQSTDSASTPPTSSSDGFSSQSTNQDNQLSQLSQLSQLAAAQEPLISSETTRPNIATAGQKRTADGHVKAPSPPSPYGPRHGHSRNTSAVSNVSSVASSRIGELSSELRTRLSYAMVKVNHGWQSNSIDEVESLASQTGSPTSSTSTLHGRRFPITSPRTAMIASRSQMSSQAIPVTHTPTGDFDLYSRSEPTSRTYESFWRDHSTPIPLNSQPATKASLAPSAEIRPTSTSRRSHTPKFSKPPTIPGQGSNSSTSSIPHTPNRVTLDNDPKPLPSSQKTLQEQDAIETLLFMSSPGNSGNMGHQFPRPSQASPQNSPLRTEFHPQDRARVTQGRRVVFQQDITRGPLRTTALSQPSYAHRSKATGKTKEDAIDRLLDEMADSSSDEAEVVLNYSSPRRVAAGRV
ncbi:hypothetical protein B0O99DRAFT_499856 [Bisporella sp. PMI_857]|nr:hypothetical protein B0O99DRAFT_499856 [Bisporella sp. PMI_857]